MAAISIVLPEDAYVVFRALTLAVYGDKKGRLSLGGSEALILWCKSVIEECNLTGEPFDSFMEEYFGKGGEFENEQQKRCPI